MSNSIVIRGKSYDFSPQFTNLHLAPIAAFMTGGINSDSNSWALCAKILLVILPDLPKSLVNTEAGQFYLNLSELKDIYTNALDIAQRQDKLDVTEDALAVVNSTFDEVAQLKKELEVLRAASQKQLTEDKK